MASVDNVKLQLVENQGAAAALVTYRLLGTPQDNAQRRVYIEKVELIGVDQFPGEDGRNDLIADSRTDNSVVFPLAMPNQMRLIALPAFRLDEDRPASPFDATAERDEIRARVTLSRAATATVVAESSTLFIHEQVLKPTVV